MPPELCTWTYNLSQIKHELKNLTISLIRFKCLTKLPSENFIRKPSQNCQKRWSYPRNCQKKRSSPLSGRFVSTECWVRYLKLYHISVLTKYTLLPFCSHEMISSKCSIITQITLLTVKKPSIFLSL